MVRPSKGAGRRGQERVTRSMKGSVSFMALEYHRRVGGECGGGSGKMAGDGMTGGGQKFL